MPLSQHFSISHPPKFSGGRPDGGRLDRISGLAELPTDIRGNHPDILAALGDVISEITITGNTIEFKPPVPVDVAHRVGDAVLGLGARVAA
ncbi:hypothetical protein IPP75_02305 [Candidatus Saccharibacteria bacterium]|nr:MAG: hypothetical protein IPP75_02305 [Candidatus Saccharibacteria bacterium]